MSNLRKICGSVFRIMMCYSTNAVQEGEFQQAETLSMLISRSCRMKYTIISSLFLKCHVGVVNPLFGNRGKTGRKMCHCVTAGKDLSPRMASNPRIASLASGSLS